MEGEEVHFENLYEDHIQQSEDIEIYEKSKRLANITEYPAMVAFLGLFVSFLIALYNILTHLASFLISHIPPLQYFQVTPAPFSEIGKFGGFFVVSVVVFAISVRIGDNFRNNAFETGITKRKYHLHLLANGVAALEEDYSEAVSILEQYRDLDNYYIPSVMEEKVDNYLSKASEGANEDYIKETYPYFVGILTDEIQELKHRRSEQLEVMIEPSESEYYVRSEPDSNDDERGPVTYKGVIAQSFEGYDLSNFKPNFWLLYIFSATVGIGIFQYVNNTLGIITVTILLTGLQIHDRRENGNEEE